MDGCGPKDNMPDEPILHRNPSHLDGRCTLSWRFLLVYLSRRLMSRRQVHRRPNEEGSLFTPYLQPHPSAGSIVHLLGQLLLVARPGLPSDRGRSWKEPAGTMDRSRSIGDLTAAAGRSRERSSPRRNNKGIMIGCWCIPITQRHRARPR